MILIISLSLDISHLKPCDLETALDSIYLEFTPHPCKYNAIKEMAKAIETLASVQLVWMFAVLYSVPRVISLSSRKKLDRRLTICIFVVSTFVHLSFFIARFPFIISF